MGNRKKVLDFLATAENISVLSTLFSHEMQNTAATGKKINSIPAKSRTLLAAVRQNIQTFTL